MQELDDQRKADSERSRLEAGATYGTMPRLEDIMKEIRKGRDGYVSPGLSQAAVNVNVNGKEQSTQSTRSEARKKRGGRAVARRGRARK